MRIGIFGGSFDPPHVGHFIAAREAMEEHKLDYVMVVPANRNPHKENNPIAPNWARVAMLENIIDTLPGFSLYSHELLKPAPSYMCSTLQCFKNRYPDAHLFLLLGEDAYDSLHTWKNVDIIKSLSTPIKMRRTGLSSTMIRERIKNSLPISLYVTETVEGIIKENGLYT